MESINIAEIDNLKEATKERTCLNVTNEDGALIQEIEYLHGVPDGKCITYDPKTQKKIQEMFFKKGILEGLMHVYDLNGDIAANLNYSNGVMNGNCEFFVEGKIVISGQYKNGQYDGKINYYDNLQNIVREENFLNGVKVGKSITYSENKQIVKSENYSNGKLDGMSVSFYPGLENQLMESVEYKDGQLNGETKIFYENGNIKEIRLYSYDKIVGNVKKYDKDGKLID